MSDQPLNGAVALVTGASVGVGAATARQLARAGAAVALVARPSGRLDQVASDILGTGGHAAAVAADITEPERAYEAVQGTLERFGRLDILVNNAAVMSVNTALHATVQEWDRMVALNVTALLHVTHAAVPHLIDAASTSPRQVADLVNVSSIGGRVARPGASAYSLTRFGLHGFAESLRQDLRSERVRVSVVAPGAVDIDAMSRLGDAARKAVGRPDDAIEALRADDVADAIGYIVTRDRRVAVNEMVVRAGDQTW